MNPAIKNCALRIEECCYASSESSWITFGACSQCVVELIDIQFLCMRIQLPALKFDRSKGAALQHAIQRM